MHRLTTVGLAAAAIMALSAPIQAANSPYPLSPHISLSFDFKSVETEGQGSDQWPMTWHSDGHNYAAWGDGKGWNGGQTKYFLGITQVEGALPRLSGTDVFGDNHSQNRKPRGLISYDNKLYMFWSSERKGWGTSTGAVSTDNGKSWKFESQDTFRLDQDGIRATGILQFGKGYTDIPSNIDSRYVYVYFADGYKTHKEKIYLGRATKSEIFNKSAYQFFNGLDDSDHPIWSSSLSKKVPVLDDPNGIEYHVTVSHNPGLNRYLLAKGHNTNELAVFESENPWGPWYTVYYDKFLDTKWKFTYQFPTKYMYDNGRTCWMMWSGWPEHDNVNFIKATLTPKLGLKPQLTAPTNLKIEVLNK